MLEILDSEFIKFARAKGVAQAPVRWKHAFRNAIIPPLTLSVFVLFGLLNGTIIIETVFCVARDWGDLLSMRCGQQIFHCWRG